MPADIRALAQEAVELAMVCECGHHRDAHEGHTRMVGQEPPRHCSACGCPRFESQSEAAAHAGMHYATIARALLDALDERDVLRAVTHSADDPCRDKNVALDRDCNAQVTESDLLLDESGIPVAPPDVPRSKRLQLRVLSILADRDKILAALPHALRSCGCEQKLVMRQRPGDRYERPAFEWPEQHEAAIEWLQGRIK